MRVCACFLASLPLSLRQTATLSTCPSFHITLAGKKKKKKKHYTVSCLTQNNQCSLCLMSTLPSRHSLSAYTHLTSELKTMPSSHFHLSVGVTHLNMSQLGSVSSGLWDSDTHCLLMDPPHFPYGHPFPPLLGLLLAPLSDRSPHCPGESFLCSLWKTIL